MLRDELNAHQELLIFRSVLDVYLVSMDGVTHFSSENVSCPECLKRQDREGTEHFYHSAITPVLVKPGMKQALPLPPEFMVQQDRHEKQECEPSAAKHWLGQHSGHLVSQTIIYLGDDLYANQPLCQLITEIYRQSFIFVCKPDSHTSLYKWIAWLEQNAAVSVLSSSTGMENMAKSGATASSFKSRYATGARHFKSIGANWSLLMRPQAKSCSKMPSSPTLRSSL